jgi:hypothetical protein
MILILLETVRLWGGEEVFKSKAASTWPLGTEFVMSQKIILRLIDVYTKKIY